MLGVVGVLDLIYGRTHGLLSKAVSLPITSPYAPAPQLPPIVISDLLSDEERARLPMDREQAISIPAVSKARNLLISTIAKFPLVALRREQDGTDTVVTRDYPWLYRTDSVVSPYERMAWTIDDLIFYGVSLWDCTRSSTDSEGRKPILTASWRPPSSWSVKEVDGHLRIVDEDDDPIPDDRFILFNSPFEGLLTIGLRTLRGARDVEEAWVGRARNPIPLIELHVTDDDQLSDDEAKEFTDAWAKARTQENGAIGYTPAGLQLVTHGEAKAELMVEGRNAIRTDVGSHLNVRASMLDGTMGVDSLTYTTTQGERNAFYEFDLPFWTDPIAQRLSLDDAVARGTRIRFDMYEAYNVPTPTGAQTED
jgi:hypothetical protein